MTTYTTSPTETLRLGDVVVLGGKRFHVCKNSCPCHESFDLNDENGDDAFDTFHRDIMQITKIVREEFAKLATKESPKFAVGQVWEGPNGHRMRIDEISAHRIAVTTVHDPVGRTRYGEGSWTLDGKGLFNGNKKDNLSLTKLIDDAPAPDKSPNRDEVTLVLSKDEAQAVYEVLGGFVIGDGPARKNTSSVFLKLSDMGLNSIKGYPLKACPEGVFCIEAEEPLFHTNEVWRTEKKYLVRVCMVRPDGAAFVRTIHNTKDAAIIYGYEGTREVSADGVIVASGDKLVEKISD